MVVSVTLRGTTFEGYASHRGQDGFQRDRRGGFASHAEAMEWARRRQLVLAGEEVCDEVAEDPVGMKLGVLSARCVERFWTTSKAAKSSQSVASLVVRSFGADTELGELIATRIEDQVLVWIEEGLSVATCNRRLAALSKMLKYAVQREWLEVAPRIERAREPQGRLRWPSEAEEARMVELLGERDGGALYADLVVVLHDTGMRVGEARKLLWDDVEDRWVRLWETKNGQARSVPLSRRVRVIMERLRAAGGAGPFASILQHQLAYRWNAAKEAMGLKDDREFVPHCLRHGCASRLVQGGVDILVVKEWLGHRDLETTLRYAHLAPKNLEAALKVLE